MNIVDIKKYCLNELKFFYNITEINSFFTIIMQSFFNISKIDILKNRFYVFSNNDLKKIDQILDDLKNFKPVEYITGETFFYDLKFFVDENVLIPRPETEELVDLVLSAEKTKKNLKVIDIGTGSGCIAVSLAKKSNFEVFASDFSENAIKIARKNARYNKVKVNFIKHNILKSEKNIFSNNENNFFDIIISNPPYVKKSEKKFMEKNVLNYEPESAIFVDDNEPFIFYEEIAVFGQKFLSSTGKIYLEINENNSNKLLDVFKSYGFTDLKVKDDINDKNRFLIIKK